jgi:small subunit ribosomal protein S1
MTTDLKTIVEESKTRPEVGTLIEGAVIDIQSGAVYVDLLPQGTGIIFGREYNSSRDIIKNLNPGDTIKAKVVEKENEDGYTELSLKEAKQALLWKEAEAAIKDKTIFILSVKDANKGGLIIDWQGLQGFLPASQLKPEHYPRVENGDKEGIFNELKKLTGEKVSVIMIAANPKEGKLIFSEKDTNPEEKKEMIGKYNLGDEVEGEIAGVVDFGVFIKLEEGLEGLVHISELDWGLVEDPREMFKLGEKVKAKVIEIKDGKISLSIKALKQNPWDKHQETYKKGDIVKGVVIKFNKHGALISIQEGVAGLVHNSLFGGPDKLREKLSLGKTYDFQITLFEPKEQKMTLAFLDKDAN